MWISVLSLLLMLPTPKMPQQYQMRRLKLLIESFVKQRPDLLSNSRSPQMWKCSVSTSYYYTNTSNSQIKSSPHLRDSGFRNPESMKSLLVKSGIRRLGIRNTAKGIGIPLESKIQVPLTKTGKQYLESIIHSVGPRI